QLIGYNVYRTDSNGVGAFSKLNTSPITQTTYIDTYPNTLVSGDFKYYVTSLFNDSKTGLPLCESSTDTLAIHFPHVGINDLTKGQIMIYPNPASEFVNVKSDYTINKIDVMNFVGQTVYSNSNVSAKTAKINVVTFTPGVYFVKISTTDGNRTVKITITR
ncbi:MAG: T9SS type A sorting domain-containing protein, partial [Bacteroidales bacterium]|nr:T9SS type A sorting domain-containing protein [Bacteroidales bacterium]